jgi:hypothetical protein
MPEFTWVAWYRAKGELDIARTAFGIRDRDPANFRVVLGGDDHIQRRCQKAVPARDLGSILIEDDGVVVRLNPAGLKARRPCDAGAQIFDQNVETGVVATRILAPARERQIALAVRTILEAAASGGGVAPQLSGDCRCHPPEPASDLLHGVTLNAKERDLLPLRKREIPTSERLRR